MKKYLCLLFLSALTLVGTLALAGNDAPEIITPRFGSDMTPEEIERVKAEVLAAYPAALDMVVKFIGDESVRKSFRSLRIAIYDPNPDEPEVHAFSNAYQGGMRNATQGVTLIQLDTGEKLAGLENVAETEDDDVQSGDPSANDSGGERAAQAGESGEAPGRDDGDDDGAGAAPAADPDPSGSGPQG